MPISTNFTNANTFPQLIHDRNLIAEKANLVDDKAANTFVVAQLATKMSVANTNTALNTKAANSFVVAQLATKMSVANTNTLVATKLAVSNANLLLATKMSVANTNAALNTKAANSFVVSELATKMSVANTNTALNAKANTSMISYSGPQNSNNTFLRGDKKWATFNANNITAGIINPARLGSGSPSNTSILYGDNIWRTVESGGVPKNYISGFILSNNSTDLTNDIDIAVGICRDDSNVDDIELTGNITKRLDAGWVVGTNQGGLDAGSIANATYHVFAIKRSDTDVVDVLFSTSATSPTMPANYDLKRRIGSIVRASGAIRKFIQTGDLFLWESPIRDLNVSGTGTSAVTRTLTVPTGLKVEVFAIFAAYGTDDNYSIASSLDSADIAPSVSQMNFSVYTTGAMYAKPLFVRTNTSAQVRTRNAVSSGLMIHTLGWRDLRGKEG